MNKTELKISTRDFGEISVPSDQILTFPSGIYAFEELKSFVLLSPLGENTYPMWLQSAEQPALCFIVYDPFELASDYNPELEEEFKVLLDIEKGDSVEYFVIAVVPENYTETTVNLKSPVVINKTKCRGAQVILEKDYKLKHPIFKNKGDV